MIPFKFPYDFVLQLGANGCCAVIMYNFYDYPVIRLRTR